MSAVQYDSQGRPFIMGPDGRISYLSPAAMGNAAGSGLGEGGGLFRHSGSWNQNTGEVENKFNWGNLLSMITAGGLGAGAASAAGLFGGGAASGGAGAASLTPGPLVGGITSTVPGAGMVSGVGIPAAAGGGGAAASSLPAWIKPAVAIGAPLAMRAARGGGPDDGPGSESFGGGPGAGGDDQLRQLMQLLMERAQRAAPVHAQAMQTAQRMGPSLQSSPQMDQAIQASRSPRASTQQDPQVLAAIHKLMNGGG